MIGALERRGTRMVASGVESRRDRLRWPAGTAMFERRQFPEHGGQRDATNVNDQFLRLDAAELEVVGEFAVGPAAKGLENERIHIFAEKRHVAVAKAELGATAMKAAEADGALPVQ